MTIASEHSSTACLNAFQAARTLVPEPTVSRKTCTKCKLNKSASDFFRFKFSSDGLQSYCKVCL